jgi:hypothetical protein
MEKIFRQTKINKKEIIDNLYKKKNKKNKNSGIIHYYNIY